MSGATIPSGGTSYLNSSRRQYISIQPFNNAFFTYTVSVVGFVNTGTLTTVTGATVQTCPAGRVLRETGRKLYPSANPGITTLLVSVYDDITGLTGFIDPSAPTFVIYSTDRPNYLANTLTQSSTSVYGSHLYLPAINSIGNPSTTNATVGSADLPGSRQSWPVNGTGPTGFPGNFVTISTTAVTTGSKIFTSLQSDTNASFLFGSGVAATGVSTLYGVSSIVSGVSFRIYSSGPGDRNTVSWFLVN